MKFLVIGLGNIGEKYEGTRHNVGFHVLDHLAQKYDVKFTIDKLAYVSLLSYKGRQIHLIKPTTYMNLSGKSVKYWMNSLNLVNDRVLVISDDLAIPFSTLRLKPSGSAGGHNGLKDIETMLHTNSYPRLRIGIGSDYRKGNQVDFVLGKFNPIETSQLSNISDKACDTILSFCLFGIEKTMNNFNN